MLILALLAAQSAPAVQTGPFKTYGDWALACDNTHFCEMTSLIPESEDSFDQDRPSMSIARSTGPEGDFEVALQVPTETAGPVALEIDGAAIARGTPSEGTVRVTGSEADALVRAMAKGAAMRVKAGARTLGSVSLAGTSAALRFIDAEQGRAGSVTAAVATGAKPASSVPAPPPVPKVTVRLSQGAATKPSASQLLALAKRAGCDDLYSPGEEPEAESFALGNGKTLVLVPCGAGAYNFTSVPFVLDGAKAAVAGFDHAVGMSEDADVPMLVNASFESGRLDSYSKGRGIGDCGSAESFGWDGAMFRLVEARIMGECRGSVNWLRVWRAEPVIAR